MAASRTYRLDTSSEELLERLEEVVRDHVAGNEGTGEAIALVRDGDGFKLLLGAGEPNDPAAYVRGTLTDSEGLVHLELDAGLVGVRPDGTRATSRELFEWVVIVSGFLAIVFIAGHLTGEYALATIGRWLALYCGIVGYRFARRALRRRSDRAELLSLVERAAGPLAALPEAGPFRARALPDALAGAAPSAAPATEEEAAARRPGPRLGRIRRNSSKR